MFYTTRVRFPATCSRTARGRRIACSGVHQTAHIARCLSVRVENGLSVGYPKAEFGSQGAYGRFTPRPSSRTRRVSPPPHEGCKVPSPLAGEGWGEGASSHLGRQPARGNLGRKLSAQAKNSVGRAPTIAPNRNLTPKSVKPKPPAKRSATHNKTLASFSSASGSRFLPSGGKPSTSERYPRTGLLDRPGNLVLSCPHNRI